MSLNINNLQMNALSINNIGTHSNLEFPSSEVSQEEALIPSQPAHLSQIPASERLYDITEIMAIILGLSLNGERPQEIRELLVGLRKFGGQSRRVINELLTTSERYGITAQQAWSEQLAHRFFYKKCYQKKFIPNYNNFLTSIKEILNCVNKLTPTLSILSIKHLSWSFSGAAHPDRALLNGHNIQENNSANKFLILLDATKEQNNIKSLNIEVSNSDSYFSSKLTLITKISEAIKNPFIRNESQHTKNGEVSLRDGTVKLLLSNNGFNFSHISILAIALNKNICQLIIENNLINEEGLEQLAEALQNTSISFLALNYVSIGNQWFLALENRFPPMLKTLSLEGNVIGNQGFRNLKRILPSGIENINLSSNRISNMDEENSRKKDKEIVNDILDISIKKDIKVLFLDNNNFTKTSFPLFVDKVKNTKLVNLNFEINNFSEKLAQSNSTVPTGFTREIKVNSLGEQVVITGSGKVGYQNNNFMNYLKSHNIA